MENTNYNKIRSAGCLEIVAPITDSDIGVYVLPASTGPQDRSINTHEFPGLEQTWGPMPQIIIARTSSEPVCGNPTGERIQLRVPQLIRDSPNFKDRSQTSPTCSLLEH